MLEYLVFVAALATLLAAFVYIRSMFRGGAKPNRVSWLMWAAAPFIATGAAVSSGVGWSVLPVFMAGFSPLLIFAASFLTKKAYWKPSSFDYTCGILSGLALILWYFTKDPVVAIVFSILSDGLATVPTMTKAWRYPETESVWPFATGVFGALSSLVAATTWNFAAFAFPSYLLIANVMVLFAIYGKKLLLNQDSSLPPD